MYKLFTDGGSRGNPGHAAIGCVIWKDSELIDLDTQYIGIATNNIAEYKALEMGLLNLRKRGIKDIEIFMDSELVVKQVKGEYKVKNDEISKEYSKINLVLKSFDSFEINYIPREQNKIADKLVNLTLDLKLKN